MPDVTIPLRTESANFTRPNDTTAYASGDLVANNTTAGSVTPLVFKVSRSPNGSFIIRRGKLKKSNNVITNASFRLHLYTSSPTVTNGDNGVWLSIESGYLGFIDIVVDKSFSDAASGHGTPVYTNVSQINVRLAGATDLATAKQIYGLLEARGAYTPAALEIFTVSIEIEPQS